MSIVRPRDDATGRRARRDSRKAARPGPVLRLLRGLSGALAAGLVVLAALLAAAHWLSGPDTVPGPSTGLLVRHGVGAALAVTLQWVADRSRGRRATIAALAVVAVVVSVLWTSWWL